MIHAHWCIITLMGRRAPPKRLHCGKFAGYASEHSSPVHRPRRLPITSTPPSESKSETVVARMVGGLFQVLERPGQLTEALGDLGPVFGSGLLPVCPELFQTGLHGL